MIHIHDRTIIRCIIQETAEWDKFREDYNPELESCIDAEDNEKKEIFIQYLMHVGKRFQKNFRVPIENLSQFEKFLFTNENYRDHVLHTFRVWGLGIFLYHKLFKSDFSEKDIDIDKFHFLWYLAAVYHDIGYPLERIQKIVKSMNENFENTGIEIEISPISSNNNLRSQEINTILEEILPGPFIDNNSLLKKNHGELSGRILIYTLYKHLGNKWNTEVKKSIKAIIIHDNEKIMIPLKDDPLSALLVICDELQEWGRPFSSLSKYHGYELSHIAFEVNFDPVQISYKYPINAIIDKERDKNKMKNLDRIKGIKINKIE